jgi:hypothetical protein
MYLISAVLLVLSGVFYAAGQHEIGSLSPVICGYAGTFCDHHTYVLTAAIVAGLWGAFVSVR